ncbi:SRPBCC family protein [Kibdelosporangium philippinense]|uniref:SRPBCC family protein n=1 Tax=Kibdelosporangium philippinense TaxID=211113 RepID=A0ABS8Z3M3_9PSEU|nr:SRPBCC family protein [Kibdelosporangium philippinense]MCE7002072.1 SRPBCC family protein [Kibdelosporangium philippinense]
MLIENSFDISASPDRVFEFLQDPHNVAACFPGAELTEDLGGDSYRGKVKIKVGPLSAAYAGTATIVSCDPATRVAVLLAEGKDARGSGSARAEAKMQVRAKEGGSTVTFATELTISGKLAQFGRGIMADVSNRMIAELAEQVRTRIDTAQLPHEAEAVSAPPSPPPMKASSIIKAMIAGWFGRLRGRFRSKSGSPQA